MGSKAPNQGKEKAVDNQQVLPALIKHITAASLGLGQRAAFRGFEAWGSRVTMTEVFCKGHCGQNRSPGKKWGQGGELALLLLTCSPQAQVHQISNPPGSSHMPLNLQASEISSQPSLSLPFTWHMCLIICA